MLSLNIGVLSSEIGQKIHLYVLLNFFLGYVLVDIYIQESYIRS